MYMSIVFFIYIPYGESLENYHKPVGTGVPTVRLRDKLTKKPLLSGEVAPIGDGEVLLLLPSHPPYGGSSPIGRALILHFPWNGSPRRRPLPGLGIKYRFR